VSQLSQFIRTVGAQAVVSLARTPRDDKLTTLVARLPYCCCTQRGYTGGFDMNFSVKRTMIAKVDCVERRCRFDLPPQLAFSTLSRLTTLKRPTDMSLE
jgi:hypothetical protein